jgi:hypothetical protein
MPKTPEIPEELPLADDAAVSAEATASAPEWEKLETARIGERRCSPILCSRCCGASSLTLRRLWAIF